MLTVANVHLHCVRGTVLNELGESVANATLTVLRNGNGSPVVKTSERGEFSFDELTPGNSFMATRKRWPLPYLRI